MIKGNWIKVVCIKETLTQDYSGVIFFNVGQIYNLYDTGLKSDYYTASNLNAPVEKDSFITLAEWRERQIDNILKNI